MFKPKNIAIINKMMIADIKKELRLQGHHDTGKLERSFKEYEGVIKNELILQAYALGYITDLEEGVPASKIRVTEADFEDLKGWVKRKIGAATPAEATGIAAAIVRKWRKEGKPLPNSRNFSSTGESTNAIKITVERNETKYDNAMDRLIENEIDIEFTKTKGSTI